MNSIFRALLLTLGLTFIAMTAVLPLTASACGPADSGSPCGGAGVASQGNSSGTNQGAGNPINVITGNKYEHEVDMPALPGVLGLEIERYYNSTLSSLKASGGTIGRGWRLSYETRLYPVGNTLQIMQADGTRIIFERNPRDPSLCATRDPAHGTVRTTLGPDGVIYIWTWPNGRKFAFDAQGKLTYIQAPTGEVVSLDYNPENELIRVTDPEGRSLTLHYADRAQTSAKSHDQFHGVQYIDSPVGRFTYGYGSTPPKGYTDSRQPLKADLVSVTNPNGVSRRYVYEDARYPTLLTGIIIDSTKSADSKGSIQRIRTWAYDTKGRGVLSVLGKPRQLDARGAVVPGTGIGQVNINYTSPTTTTLTNSLGQKTIYTYTVIGNEHRLVSVTGAGCSSCGETNVRYGYDQLGRLVEKTTLSETGQPLQTTRTTRDRLGRVVSISRNGYQNGKPETAEHMVRYAYTGKAIEPDLIARPSVVPGKEFVTHITYNTEGQPTEVTESGFSPIDAKGRPQPTALTRTTTYTYQTINGHSLLTQIDGPLPDGPTQSPADSDITQFEWDRDGAHVIKLTSPLQLVARYTYDPAGRIKAVTDPDGITMHIDDNYFGSPKKVLRQVAGGSHGWSFQYDVQNRLIQVSRVDGSHERPQNRMVYDIAGRLLWQATALGTLKQASYDTEGHVLSGSVRTAGHEQSERYGYDDMGRLIFVSDGTGSTYHLQYTKNGQLQSVINPLGQITRLTFDAALRPVSATTAADTHLARTLLVSRNQAEQSLTVMPALKDQHAPTVTTRTLRDDFGRIVAITRPNSGKTTYSYDDDNRLIRKTNALGQARHYQYDVAGRLIRQYTTQAAGSAVPESTTTYRYTGTRLVETIDPAQTTRYGYNEWGQLTSKTVVLHPHQGTEITATTNYAYDQQGRIATKTLPDGSLLRYVRDGQGQIVTMQWRDGPSGPTRTVVSNLKRDLVGLAELTYGNGIQAKWQRSKAGVLARIVYSTPDASPQTNPSVAGTPLHLDWLSSIVSPAKAAEPVPRQGQNDWPGAYGLPVEPNTLWDARYLYGDLVNILAVQHQGDLVGGVTQSRYNYDLHNELIEARYGQGPVLVRSDDSSNGGSSRWVAQQPDADRSWRYLLDGNANRLYAQQDSRENQPAKTQTIRYQPNSQRLQGARYDAVGQIQENGALRLHWNAEGRLHSLWNREREIAEYRYNVIGERVAKIVNPRSDERQETLYLYDEQRHRQAKLDADGRILRQYLWLGDKLVAVVDYPEGRTPLGSHAQDTLDKVTRYIDTLWGDSLPIGGSGRIRYLLDNHLGAPIAATDARGHVIWRMQYGPYGQPLDADGTLTNTPFSLSLRNPGQWQDQESGFYYNDYRYYDPATGRYLSPDPLGLAGGLNAYAYVAANPIAYTDPYGLMLFAFDGTNNGTPEHLIPGNDTSNVYRFYDAYQFTQTDPRYYITGIGTIYPEKNQNYRGNAVTGDGFDERLVYATDDLTSFIRDNHPTDTLNIDVVGFSRGAAEARAWINQIAADTTDGVYRFTDGGTSYSACLNFRFEGLFDTVPHLGTLGGGNASLNLSIPDQVQYAVQALALNENRGGLTNFNAYSIMPTPTTSNSTTLGATRIEQGFIGSHSDIGGGYGVPGTTNDTPEGDLSNVAFTWMYNQATAAGVPLNPNKHTEVNSPILHDEVAAQSYYVGGRTIRFGDGSTVGQIDAQINSAGDPAKVTEDWTTAYITQHRQTRTVWPDNGGAPYTELVPPCPNDASISGMVDMTTYGAWLASIGVQITSTNPTPTQQMCQ